MSNCWSLSESGKKLHNIKLTVPLNKIYKSIFDTIDIFFIFIFRKELKTTASDLTDNMKSDKKEIKDKIDGEYAGKI